MHPRSMMHPLHTRRPTYAWAGCTTVAAFVLGGCSVAAFVGKGEQVYLMHHPNTTEIVKFVCANYSSRRQTNGNGKYLRQGYGTLWSHVPYASNSVYIMGESFWTQTLLTPITSRTTAPSTSRQMRGASHTPIGTARSFHHTLVINHTPGR